MLKESTLNFIGNVEGHDLFTGKVDVIVMDGFTGNVVLKASETLAESLMHLIKEELMRTPLRKLGRDALRAAPSPPCKHRIDPDEYGGAPLLGVKGCCVIGHGRSDARRHQARHPRRRRVLHERRQPAHRGRAAGPGRAQGSRRSQA